METLIDASSGQVTVHYTDHGKERVLNQKLELPPDLANGLMFTLVKDIDRSAPQTVSMLVTTPKPRLVKLAIFPEGEKPLSSGSTGHKAMLYDVKVQIGGMAGLLARERGERMQMLIEVATKYPRVPGRIARHPYPAEHRVPGCESEAYVWAELMPGGTLNYYFAVENPQGISAMALSAILGKALSGVPPEQIESIPADIIYRIFGRELSMGKSLGLMGIVNMVRAAARQHLAPMRETSLR